LFKSPYIHGNINIVWNKIGKNGKFPNVFHKQRWHHGIFPSIDRKKTQNNRGIYRNRVVVTGHSRLGWRNRFLGIDSWDP
jgi:hypothetical protein